MKYLLFVLLLFGCGKKSDTPSTNTVNVTNAACSVAAAPGGSEITCPDGTSTFVANGTNGLNGTTITPVQLCPGFVPTYPNVFPESALCISHVLYGVYSANGGFLAELPPGAYSSDGINASCNLLIEANCVVTKE